MAHINIPEHLPGIVGLFAFRPETAQPLCELAEILLRGPSSLTSGERELIAAFVSYKNHCHFCHSSHGAAAACHLNDEALVQEVKEHYEDADISDKLKALLRIAEKVQENSKSLNKEMKAAKKEGVTEMEIHDTVLIAAAFCMYNRYVDGLGTWAPSEPEAYAEMGKKLAEKGYLS